MDAMKTARLRLLLAALLFFAWIGWLAYLAAKVSLDPPIVLSRPQFLVSNLDVIAEVDQIPDRDDQPTSVKVIEVHYPPGEKALQGKVIQVAGLARCRKDWKGPGQYILPLVRSDDKYFIAAIPHSPGFPPSTDQARSCRIYPVNPQTMAQLNSMPKLDR
ncbi:MAG TPA: hypothetical protein VG099_01780 [Gemmataceae bacterium]|nr:hypothetical protein [Gemmataceae bacterium]